MKYGAINYLWSDRWSDDTLGLLDHAKELGLDYLGIAIGDDVQFTPRLTRQRAEALGMELMTGPGGEWPLDCDISADDPVDRRKGLEWHRRMLDITAEAGAVAYAGAVYGHPGRVALRRPPADEYPRTAENLHLLAEHASQLDVTLVLEATSHFRTHLVNIPEQLMRLIEMADHENISGLLDTYHMVTEVRDYGAAVRTVADRLWGIDACESDRGVPGGGLVPWETLFGALAEIGFDGYIGLESYNSSIGDFAYERAKFHNVCPDGDAFVREGLSFLRSLARKFGL